MKVRKIIPLANAEAPWIPGKMGNMLSNNWIQESNKYLFHGKRLHNRVSVI